MVPPLQFRRGLRAFLPTLANGEPGFCTDTHDLFLGTGAGNIAVSRLAWKTIAVAGQGSLVADSESDTLTIAAGANVTLTTDPATDTLTIAAAGGGGTTAPAGANHQVQFNDGGAFGAEAAFSYDKATDTVTVSAGSIQVQLNAGGTAVAAQNSGGVVAICTGALAVDVQTGSVAVLGTSTNTYRWGSGAAAPNLNSGTPNMRYGADTNYCGEPDVWLLVNVGGTDYKVPAYL